MFRYSTIALAALLTALGPFDHARAAAQSATDAVTAAIADPARPAADREQDENRKPQAVLEFAGIKPGDKAADLLPGGGYVTRLFSKVVGKDGHVYAVVPAEITARNPKADDAVQQIADDPAYGNVTVLVQPIASFSAPEQLDLVWTSMNYHDLHNLLEPDELAAFNKTVFNALKSGGTFVVVDHAAAAGSGARDTSTLHRIDPETVKQEVQAAGFKLEASSDVLANAEDQHTLKVFDPSIRGRTDKFIFKFRKP